MSSSYVGSKWWKFDFHNHTPASDDYGKGPDQAQLKLITPKDWLLSYMRQQIDCVAVTDHNSGAWIDPLKAALEELERESHPEYRPITLFPGVEITVQGNIHILAILDPNKSSSDIDTLLGAVKYFATKGLSDGCTLSSASEVIDEITRLEGIAIPAHVNQPSGLFRNLYGSSLKQVLNNSNVLAMEVVDTSIAKPSLYNSEKTNWAEIIGSDSHHPSGNSGQCYPGSSFTWVKMSKPSCKGLRLALIDGSLSLKRSDSCSTDPNIHGPLIIESIIVNNAKYLGRGNSFEIKLNPWLNTIIGGRGTGKSTSLEFIRAVLSRRHEIPKSLEEDLSKYNQTSLDRNDNGLLTSNTCISAYFKKDETRFRVTLTKLPDSTSQHAIEEYTNEGTWIVSEGDISNRFPIRIYSQKQIFELAKHPQALLRIIDDASSVDYRSWGVEWDSLVNSYYTIRASQRELMSGLGEETLVKGQLQDIDRKLEIFERAGHSHILQSYRLSENKDKDVIRWEKTWDNKANELRAWNSRLSPLEMQSEYLSVSNEVDKEMLDAAYDVRESFKSIQDEITELATKIDLIRDDWFSRKQHLQLSTDHMTAKNNYNNLIDELNNAGAGEPAEYGELINLKQQLTLKLNSFNDKRIKAREHEIEAQACLDSIYAHRLKLSQLRADFLENTLGNNQHVQIKVLPFQDKSTLIENFRSLIGRGTSGFERDIGDNENNEGLLLPLKQASQSDIENKVSELKQRIIDIHHNKEDAVKAVIDRRFTTHIQSLTPEQIDRIQVWFPNDFLELKYSLQGRSNFKPVEQGSPGQKTAALLAFIFSYGEEPLLLDQPEDDLDNGLISDLIVTQLKKIKSKRQVIIVTHNANIVVNGDSENIIALDIRQGLTRVVEQGGLQESSVRDEVCRVMEGGKDAFRLRYKRLGDYGS